MPRLDLDLTEAQDFGEIEEGPYEAEVTGVGDPETGEKSVYVSVEFTIQEGDYAGRKVWRNYPITGKGAGFFADLWEKCVGEKLDYGEAGISVDTDELLSAPVTVIIGHREFEGQTYNDVKRVLAA